jgi:hypothetical protein
MMNTRFTFGGLLAISAFLVVAGETNHVRFHKYEEKVTKGSKGQKIIRTIDPENEHRELKGSSSSWSSSSWSSSSSRSSSSSKYKGKKKKGKKKHKSKSG